MTTENELNLLQTSEKKDEEGNNPLPTNNEGTVEAKVEDEQVSMEKPKRGGGRKKRDVPTIDDVKIEDVNNDNAMDTQPLFEQPVILEGKRSRKPTSRLELSDLATPKKELSIPQVHIKRRVVHTYSKITLFSFL